MKLPQNESQIKVFHTSGDLVCIWHILRSEKLHSQGCNFSAGFKMSICCFAHLIFLHQLLLVNCSDHTLNKLSLLLVSGAFDHFDYWELL